MVYARQKPGIGFFVKFADTGQIPWVYLPVKFTVKSKPWNRHRADIRLRIVRDKITEPRRCHNFNFPTGAIHKLGNSGNSRIFSQNISVQLHFKDIRRHCRSHHLITPTGGINLLPAFICRSRRPEQSPELVKIDGISGKSRRSHSNDKIADSRIGELICYNSTFGMSEHTGRHIISVGGKTFAREIKSSTHITGKIIGSHIIRSAIRTADTAIIETHDSISIVAQCLGNGFERTMTEYILVAVL